MHNNTKKNNKMQLFIIVSIDICTNPNYNDNVILFKSCEFLSRGVVQNISWKV